MSGRKKKKGKQRNRGPHGGGPATSPEATPIATSAAGDELAEEATRDAATDSEHEASEEPAQEEHEANASEEAAQHEPEALEEPAHDGHDASSLEEPAQEESEPAALEESSPISAAAPSHSRLEEDDDELPEQGQLPGSAVHASTATERERLHLKGLIEALVFATDKPIRVVDLARITDAPNKLVRQLLGEIAEDFRPRGLQLGEVAGGYLFRTNPRYGSYVRELTQQKPVKLTRAQVETLAILAYRQPITRPEIDEIRGVDSGPVLKMLLERELVRILGKKDEPGRPLLYGTTPAFLEFFGLKSLKELPNLRQFTDLTDESHAIMEKELGESWRGPSHTEVLIDERIDDGDLAAAPAGDEPLEHAGDEHAPQGEELLGERDHEALEHESLETGDEIAPQSQEPLDERDHEALEHESLEADDEHAPQSEEPLDERDHEAQDSEHESLEADDEHAPQSQEPLDERDHEVLEGGDADDELAPQSEEPLDEDEAQAPEHEP